MLRNFWYLAARGVMLRPGVTLQLKLLGDSVLIGRRRNGQVFAFSDRCPHRGMPLRHARFAEDVLRCCFHGWKFDVSDGRCIEIPSLDPQQKIDTRRFGLRAYPCREVQGNVWVFVPARDGHPAAEELPPIPQVPVFGDGLPQVGATMRFPCPVDQAVIGFFDPAHPPFVHTSRWWKSKLAALHPKEKHYEPTALGFRMKRHALINGALPYRVLGHDPMIEIAIELPGIRIEHIEGTRHSVCVLAAATPVDETTTEVHYCIYWTPRWMGPLKPIARWLTRAFLRQDRDVAAKLGSSANESLPLLVGDPDAQIKWYYRLKGEYQRSQAAQQPFVNPIQPRTLRWRS
jgi:phenylpropionate dioxygenase-like ring-hydroxylating dioxygenase large terminal subunit